MPSSKSKAKGKQIKEVSSSDFSKFFINEEAMTWYTEHQNNNFIQEKTVEKELDQKLGFSAAFDTIGWERALRPKTYYYPEAVRHFYSNMPRVKPSGDDLTICTKVNGTDIALTEEHINHFLKLKPQGFPLRVTKRKGETFATQSDPTWSLDRALTRLGINTSPHSKLDIRATQMDAKSRILVSILHSNVLPRMSAKHKARPIDIYLIDKLMFGLGNIEGIPLAPLILGAIWDTATSTLYSKAFAFPCLISRLLRAFHVDLSFDYKETSSTPPIIDGSILHLMNINQNDQGQWINDSRKEPLPSNNYGKVDVFKGRPPFIEVDQTRLPENAPPPASFSSFEELMSYELNLVKANIIRMERNQFYLATCADILMNHFLPMPPPSGAPPSTSQQAPSSEAPPTDPSSS